MDKVLIASVLKPINDPRAYAKLALSLRETNKYHLNIIGFSAKKTPQQPNLVFNPLFAKHRLHYTRWLVPFRFIKHVKSYKPDLVVVTTYELLPYAVWTKKQLGFRLIYDVQENYARNVQLNRTMPSFLANLVAKAIRLIESKASKHVDHFLLAEKCYRQELPFLGEYTVLENRFQGKPIQTSPFKINADKNLEFIISGTLTEVYGISEAIIWFQKLREKWPNIKLKILGHITTPSYAHKLETLIGQDTNITLIGSSTPIPYPQIEAAVRMADIVLLPYRNLPSIRYKIPTKLFESLALAKPIILSPNQQWETFIAKYEAGMAVDFDNPELAPEHFEHFLSQTFYQNTPDPSLTWEQESTKWINLVDNLLR